MANNYDGVLLDSHLENGFLSLLHCIDAPFIVPIHSARGHNSSCINIGLLWYAAMRPFDAFLVPTNSVRDLYGRFVSDKNSFMLYRGGLTITNFIHWTNRKRKMKLRRCSTLLKLLLHPLLVSSQDFSQRKGPGFT